MNKGPYAKITGFKLSKFLKAIQKNINIGINYFAIFINQS